MRGPEGIGDNEEELIGDTLYGATSYYQNTGGGPRARFLVKLGNDSMYYLVADHHRWGWYAIAVGQQNCGAPDHPERHDIDGDGVADSTTHYERHCIPNGEYNLTIDSLVWNEAGTAVVQRGTLFSRRVAMLGTLGSYIGDPSSWWYHDVRVSLDLWGVPEGFGLTGDVRAGDYFLSWSSQQPLYTPGTSFTTAAGDTLWFQSTYVATASYPRPWLGRQRAILTGFNFNYVGQPGFFRGGVNSAPGTETSPALWVSPPTSVQRQVVGRVVAPHHVAMDSGVTQTGASVYVTVVGLTACFNVTGNRIIGSMLTFDAHCSTGMGTLEYRWTFGDGAAVDWNADSVVVHHVYAAQGPVQAVLHVRRATSTAPVDSTVQTLDIAGPLDVAISGPDWITSSGTYTWTSLPLDGVPPYDTYRWYYQQGGSAEYLDGTRATYKRYVSAQGQPYVFRLRHTVQDAVPSQAEDTLWVDVVPGGGYAAIGLVDASGVCRPLPAQRRARQAAHAAIARSGRWPVPCAVPTS